MAKTTHLIALSTYSNGAPVRDDGAGDGDITICDIAITIEVIHTKILKLNGFAVGLAADISDVGQVDFGGAGEAFNNPDCTAFAANEGLSPDPTKILEGFFAGFNLNNDGHTGFVNGTLGVAFVTVSAGGNLDEFDILTSGTGAAAGGLFEASGLDPDHIVDIITWGRPGAVQTGALAQADILTTGTGVNAGGTYDASALTADNPGILNSISFGVGASLTGALAVTDITNDGTGAAAGGTWDIVNLPNGTNNVLVGVAFGPGSTFTGAFDEAARNVDPGITKVLAPASGGPTNYKIAGSTIIGTATLPSAANVATGSGAFGVGGSGSTPSYPATATTNATARGVVNAVVAGIIRQADGGPTITIGGVNCNNGTFNLAADDAAHVATGRELQLADDTATLVANKGEMLTTNTGIQLVFGSTTKGTATGGGLRNLGRGG